ncbi:hypothetical protein J3458_020296 [Metarhizium acridum]|uniref:uncharacterized protein n=1 Tax=Metarhizium acridum TaxID=92637 RepID=UPI001C6CBE8E|nr:hypothetical protein J3458_020296 [Metarhizium acridum]
MKVPGRAFCCMRVPWYYCHGLDFKSPRAYPSGFFFFRYCRKEERNKCDELIHNEAMASPVSCKYMHATGRLLISLPNLLGLRVYYESALKHGKRRKASRSRNATPQADDDGSAGTWQLGTRHEGAGANISVAAKQISAAHCPWSPAVGQLLHTEAVVLNLGPRGAARVSLSRPGMHNLSFYLTLYHAQRKRTSRELHMPAARPLGRKNST